MLCRSTDLNDSSDKHLLMSRCEDRNLRSNYLKQMFITKNLNITSIFVLYKLSLILSFKCIIIWLLYTIELSEDHSHSLTLNLPKNTESGYDFLEQYFGPNKIMIIKKRWYKSTIFYNRFVCENLFDIKINLNIVSLTVHIMCRRSGIKINYKNFGLFYLYYHNLEKIEALFLKNDILILGSSNPTKPCVTIKF